MKRLLKALAPTVLAYAWRHRTPIKRWIVERRREGAQAGAAAV